MKFQYTGRAVISHINARKEGDEMSKELAVDLKLEVLTDTSILPMLGDGLEDFLFLPGGAVRNLMLGPLEFKHEMEHYRFESMGSTHHGCKVKKIKAQAIDGSASGAVILTFGVSFKPSGDEVARMAEYLQDEIEIALSPSDGELDLDGKGGAE